MSISRRLARWALAGVATLATAAIPLTPGHLPALATPRQPVPTAGPTSRPAPRPPAHPPTTSRSENGPVSLVTSATAPLVVRYAPGYGQQHTFRAFLPANPTGHDRAAVLIIHGGGWVRGAADAMDHYDRRLYALGVPSFSLSYRLATRDDLDTAWPAQRDDVYAAVRYIKDHARSYGIDPGHLSVLGSSAGGQLAATLGLASAGSAQVRAVVTYSAPMDLAIAYAGKNWLSEAVRDDLMRCAPTDPADSCQRRWHSADLPDAVSAADSPALLFYQRREWVTYRHGVAYRDAYRRRAPSVPVRLDLAEGTSHGLYAFDTQNGIAERVWTKTLDWLRAYG